jgi:hypothetical protein
MATTLPDDKLKQRKTRRAHKQLLIRRLLVYLTFHQASYIRDKKERMWHILEVTTNGQMVLYDSAKEERQSRMLTQLQAKRTTQNAHVRNIYSVAM